MLKLKTSLLTLSFMAILSACVEEPQQAEKSEINTSALPDIPPLTYTWSHPDCPFTIDFPSKPKDELLNESNRTLTIDALLQWDKYQIYFGCDKNILNLINIDGLEKNFLIEQYAEQFTTSLQTTNPKFYKIIDDDQYLWGKFYTYHDNYPIKGYYNSWILNFDNSMAILSFYYTSGLPMEDAGEEIYKSIKLNNNFIQK